jgi:Domain of unknown function (DUF4383)
MSTAEDRTPAGHDRWTPARMFMVVSTLYHLPLGIAGLIYDQTFPIGAAAAERAGSELVFGIFETNGWHSVAALALGIISVYYVFNPRRARDAALAIGLFHVGIVASLEIWQPSTFWLASNFADQVIHTSTAIGGIASALLTKRTGSEAARSG